MRVVLYAEGPGEGESLGRLPPQPNAPLGSAHWGPGHLLVERVLREHVGIDHVEFVAPLRDARGRSARGSLLRDQAILKRLLTWARNAPDLAVALIDGDGDTNERRRRLLSAREARKVAHPPVVVIVCSPEFEAWLLADSKAIEAAFGCPGSGIPQAESLAPREAKAHWNGLCGWR